MKRSEINALMKEAVWLLKEHSFYLPPFAFWSPEEWRQKGKEYDEIRDNCLGWDITDFGSRDFNKCGLFLFTLRNGNQHVSKYKKTYAEKIMIVKENQVTPFHFHFKKMEDIINRGGGNLIIKLYNSTKDGKFDTTPVMVNSDGRLYEIPAGGIVKLTPGESITLHQGQYHSFWGEDGSGTVMVTEVSQSNDDTTDNRFYEEIGRFPEIEEDEMPLYLMGNEYNKIRDERKVGKQC